MKFTSKKTVSEVVIDFENGSIFSIKKGGISEMLIQTTQESCWSKTCWNVRVHLSNGLSADFVTMDEDLILDLNMLST